MSDPWYREGLRFECRRCGRCCTGEPGFVWVTSEELRRLAKDLGLSVVQFRRRYTREAFGRISLTERANGDCVLLDDQGACVAYADRPAQCRSWPFWPSNLTTPATWRAACRICPGAGHGRLYNCDQIARLAALVNV